MNENCRPIRIKMSQVSGFTLEAINGWTKEHVVPGSTVFTDGLGCFRGVAEAGSNQVASRSPRRLDVLQEIELRAFSAAGAAWLDG